MAEHPGLRFTANDHSSTSHLDNYVTVVASIGVSVLVVLIVVCVTWVKRNNKRIKKMMQLQGSQGRNHYNSPSFRSKNIIFSYEELNEATNEFSDANVLGRGGLGLVYRGTLPDGTLVAVKSLRPGSQQGDQEFNAEVHIISQVHHRNLVSLVGYCPGPEKKLLVYKYVPNNTLDYHLHGNPDRNLEWSRRQKIAIGSAKGLAYLHYDCQPQIIHRDIKTENILLEDDYEPRVADFGLARLKGDSATHISTRLIGTPGYIAPECFENSKATIKTDVFAFGVMLVAIITGKKPIGASDRKDDSYIEEILPLMKTSLDINNYRGVVDPRLGDTYDLIELAGMVACALACVRETPHERPRMQVVARVLEGIQPISALTVRAISELELLLRK